MVKCAECKSFFPNPDNPETGDCVKRTVDPRQAYYQSKPVNSEQDASGCENFQKK